MLSYIGRRLLIMIPTLVSISILAFVVVQLPGDYISSYVTSLQQRGYSVTEEMIDDLRHTYGFDRPGYVRYFIWIGRFVRGDLGYSLTWQTPVADLLLSRLLLTMVVSVSSLLFSWAVAFPIGVNAAVRQYSLGDYFWTVIGFLGLSIPNFLLALVLMFVGAKYLNISVGGLFSQDFELAPWSLPKLVDLIKHLWIPMIIVGTDSAASLIRILRANLLDELRKPYVDYARARGLKESALVTKYPLRIAINPFISSVGWVLPRLISGTVITAVVLDLPTAGPLFLAALRNADMPVAGAFIMLTGVLTVIGTLVSDILLAILDPRIRYA